MEGQPDRDRIVDEAVGQTHGTAPPDTVNETIHSEEAIRRNSTPPGPQASMSEKTAAAVGERVGDAYADAGDARSSRQEKDSRQTASSSDPRQNLPNRDLSAGREESQALLSGQFSNGRFVSLVAAFGLGFIAATVLRRRH